ncbi:MAG TPA: cupin domain-containing protein [Polyangia bacterium]|jgi:uncharacterized cupin superfamily protein|nr:cupin domain-containing protein [Polyangia bacterium]
MSERRANLIIHTRDVAEQHKKYPGTDEGMRYDRDIGRAVGLAKIGLHVVRLPPGTRSSYPHCEEKEEELVYVLAGEVSAWIDGEIFPMRAGDLAGFPSGTGICHTFINDGDTDAVLLVGGEATRDDNRIFYPLNPERRAVVGDAEWWADAPYAPKGTHDGKPQKR